MKRKRDEKDRSMVICTSVKEVEDEELYFYHQVVFCLRVFGTNVDYTGTAGRDPSL